MILLVSVGAVSGVYAFGGGMRGVSGNEEAITALESGDYNSFINALSETPEKISEGITEEKFNEMVKHHSE